MVCQNKFWTQQFSELFCNLQVIPLSGMSLEQQMNALTRLSLIIFFIILLLNWRWGLGFLFLSFTFIIIFYYIQKRKMNKDIENFELPRYLLTQDQAPIQHANVPIQKIPVNQGQQLAMWNFEGNELKLQTPEQYRFCLDTVKPKFGPDHYSANQKLAGSPNPKTKISPVVIAPPSALDYWRANNLITHSHINKETQEELYQSGYVVSDCCGDLSYDAKAVPSDVTENFTPSRQPMKPSQVNNQVNGTVIKNFTPLTSGVGCNPVVELPQYNFPYRTTQPTESDYLGPRLPGDVLTNCGYNPKQLRTSDLPTNLGAGNCMQDPVMKTYNKNLFTNIIQPDVYSYSQIIEPINENIGISWNQQMPPTTCNVDEKGGILYTEHDPRLVKPKPIEPNYEVINEVNNANIYDPRFHGAGTSYRSYVDKMTGQPRFMYDDVNAIRRPNYLVRSNIDHEPYADSYGPLKAPYGNEFNSHIRALANDSFMRNSVEQRNDLQERLMQKAMARKWQMRLAPMQTNRFSGLGYMSCRS